jgi:pimeloyl-ACP methyl ester carboxylesterase
MYAAFLAMAMASLGGADVFLTPGRSGSVDAPWWQSLSGLDRPTERTEETLKRYDLADRYRRDPAGALMRLENHARARPEPEVVFALSELSWIEASRHNRRRRTADIDSYLDAVAYAYDFLFDPDLAAGRDPSDPRFRQAMNLYNGGLDHILRAAKAKGPIEPGGTIVLKDHGRELRLRISLASTPWKADDIDELLLASDFQISGLPTRTYQFGLGVPLIAVRKGEPWESKSKPAGPERFYPPEMAYALTAFLQPNSRLRESPVDAQQVRDSTLHLLDPLAVRSVRFKQGEREYALGVEADMTKPLAYMWSRTDFGTLRWAGLLRPGEAAERTGLMLLRPYEPDKIPVVMVHGLMSSPLAWIPMLNGLLHDPTIQQRYQFLLYVYPTGVPVPVAASYLRDALKDAQLHFDPQGNSPTFNRMVLLGHSMGGLLSHAMAVGSGNRFWELNSDRPFGQIVGPPAVLNEFRHYTFFEALPFVERVVFLASPHRGSDLARRPIGRIGSSLISEPDAYSQLLARLAKDNRGDLDPRQFRHLPTSIETLEPDSPVLMALLRMEPRPGVVFHSIIGANRPGPKETTTDGIVPYRSSHLEGVASELVVRSGHGVQQDPEAILEVRRILLEHANVPAPPTPASAPPAAVATPAVAPVAR